MRTASFAKASEVLDQLDEWLGSLGIEPKRDRWHQAAEMVQRAKERREVIEQRGSRPPIDNYVDGLFEATEIHGIMRAFQGNIGGIDLVATAPSGLPNCASGAGAIGASGSLPRYRKRRWPRRSCCWR